MTAVSEPGAQVGASLSGRTGRLAAFYGGGEPLRILEFPVPAPGPGAILVEVRRANVCGSDLHYWRGTFDPRRLGRELPLARGHEGVGVVAALGSGVEADARGEPLAPGNRVTFRYFFPCGTCRACLKRTSRACPSAGTLIHLPCRLWPHFRGTFADYVYLHPNHAVFKLPDDIPDEIAAAANCAVAQVVCAFDTADLKLGENVVIQGAGGLGLYAVAVARERGAGRVIVLDGVNERLELATAFGADEVIDIRAASTPESRIRRVRELTGGWGADVVLELVGLPEIVPEGIAMTGYGGRYMEIGAINPGLTCVADPSNLVLANRSLHGVGLYEPSHLAEALDLLRTRRDRYPFHRLTSHVFPLERINEAFVAQSAGTIHRASIVP